MMVAHYVHGEAVNLGVRASGRWWAIYRGKAGAITWHARQGSRGSGARVWAAARGTAVMG
jgi:hypothetical protein